MKFSSIAAVLLFTVKFGGIVAQSAAPPKPATQPKPAAQPKPVAQTASTCKKEGITNSDECGAQCDSMFQSYSARAILDTNGNFKRCKCLKFGTGSSAAPQVLYECVNPSGLRSGGGGPW